MNREHYCIISDLDGTFFDNSSKPHEKNLEAIDIVKKHGDFFSFATGRFFDPTKNLVFPFFADANAPICLSNGAYYCDPCNGMKSIKESSFDGHILENIVNYIHVNYPKIQMRYTNKTGLHFMFEDDNAKFEDWYKLVIVGEYKGPKNGDETMDKDLIEIQRYINENAPSDFICEFSYYYLLEFIKKGNTKSDFVLFLKDYYRKKGFNIKVVAIGDYFNDIGMLDSADIAVCPSNSHELVLKLVKSKGNNGYIVCDNNNGSVFDFVKKIYD